MNNTDSCSIYAYEKEIHTLEEYIGFIREYSKKNNGDVIWYRGQRRNDRVLEPTLYRGKKLVQNTSPGEIRTLKYEFNLNFLEELKLFKKKYKEKPQLPEGLNDFHYMFIGQHYGLETPALDWTTDPLIALYFAISHCKEGDDSSPIVFLLNPIRTNEYYSSFAIDNEIIKDIVNVDNIAEADKFLEDTFRDPNEFFTILCVETKRELCHRMSRQSGAFTLLNPIQPLSYPWIQIVAEGMSLGTSVLVDRSKVENILNDLHILGINEETIYGNPDEDYDELCKEIVESLKGTSK